MFSAVAMEELLDRHPLSLASDWSYLVKLKSIEYKYSYEQINIDIYLQFS